MNSTKLLVWDSLLRTPGVDALFWIHRLKLLVLDSRLQVNGLGAWFGIGRYIF